MSVLKYQPVRFLPLPEHPQILGNQDTLKVHETGPLRMRHVQLSKPITRLCLPVAFLIMYTYANTSLWQYTEIFQQYSGARDLHEKLWSG